MNNDRRKRLDEAFAMIENAKSILEEIQSEEQDTYDNMPESFQNGEKGEKVQAAIDALTGAVDGCDTITSSIETAKE